MGSLIDALQDSPWNLVESAARAPVNVGSPSAGPLVARLTDRDKGLHGAVQKCLGDLEDPLALKGLRNASAEEEKSNHCVVMKALGKVVTPGVPHLIALLDDPHPAVLRPTHLGRMSRVGSGARAA